MRYDDGSSPKGLVHRGGGALAGENTLEAFALATGLGFRYLESDVRASSDGYAVLVHDATLDRTTEASGPVVGHTLAQLRALRVRPPGAGAPTGGICALEDALDTFDQACFSLDLKDAAAIGPLVRAVRRTRAAERVCVAGAWDGWLDAVRDALPGVSTALGWRSLTALLTCARVGVRPPRQVATGEFAHVPMALGTVAVSADRVVEAAHDLGLRVVTWTIDEPRLIERVLDAGVDAVISDRPDALRETLLRRGAWLAACATRLEARLAARETA